MTVEVPDHLSRDPSLDDPKRVVVQYQTDRDTRTSQTKNPSPRLNGIRGRATEEILGST